MDVVSHFMFREAARKVRGQVEAVDAANKERELKLSAESGGRGQHGRTTGTQ